jgi:hypothetical protein
MNKLNAAIYHIKMPDKIKRLPISSEGYPTPWFVATLPDGTRDFRVADEGKMYDAIKRSLCWVCGQQLGVHKAFILGPMCVITRTTSEPPSHLECAEYSAVACPFLTKPKMRRNRAEDLPEGHERPGGVMLDRNPGVCAIWVTRSFKLFREQNKILFTVGDPEKVMWLAGGRAARRPEIDESIRTGLPFLEAMAEDEGPEAEQDLAAKIARAQALLPVV